MLPLVVLVLVLQSRADTLGKSNAQILAMGHDAWYAFYTKRQGESTAGMSSAEGLYADALAWRNDRLRRPRTVALRKVLQGVRNDAVEVGSALTGGGTMWNIIAAGLYVRQEETLYDVLRSGGKSPKRVVSDVDKAYRRLEAKLGKAQMEPQEAKDGRAAFARLRRGLDALVAEARRQSRKGSDALLDYGVRMVEAADEGD